MKVWVSAVALSAALAATPALAQTSSFHRALMSVCIPFTQFDLTVDQAAEEGRTAGFTPLAFPLRADGPAYREMHTSDGPWRIELSLEQEHGGWRASCAIRRRGPHLRSFEIMARSVLDGRPEWGPDLSEDEAAWRSVRQHNGRRLQQHILLGIDSSQGFSTEAMVSGYIVGPLP